MSPARDYTPRGQVSPRQRFDAAVVQLADAAMAGDRAEALRALADAESFIPADLRRDARVWLEDEQRRVDGLDGDPAAEPRGWAR